MDTQMWIAAAFGAGFALVLTRLATLERRLNRLSRLDAKLDVLLKHAGLTFDEFADVPPEVREALDRGERILAVKRFRRARGVDLKEAKEYVDEIRRRRVSPR